MGVKRPEKGSKWRLWREHATCLQTAQLLFQYAVMAKVAADESQEKNRRKTISYNNLQRKSSAPNISTQPDDVAFHSILTSCRVGSAGTGSARGSDGGGPRRLTRVVLDEQSLPVADSGSGLLTPCPQRAQLSQPRPSARHLETSGRPNGGPRRPSPNESPTVGASPGNLRSAERQGRKTSAERVPAVTHCLFEGVGGGGAGALFCKSW